MLSNPQMIENMMNNPMVQQVCGSDMMRACHDPSSVCRIVRGVHTLVRTQHERCCVLTRIMAKQNQLVDGLITHKSG